MAAIPQSPSLYKTTSYYTFEHCQKIFVSGPVGVGKTKFLNALYEKIQKQYEGTNTQIHVIPEFIDGDGETAHIMLDKYIRNEMSAYEFQNYVISFYEKYIRSIIDKVDENDIIIFERLPDESVAIFSNISYQKGLMTQLEFKKLYNKALEIDTKFGIPSLFNKLLVQYVFICLQTLTDIDISESASNYVFKCNQNIVIGLHNTINTCYRRILNRGRECESAYTYDDVVCFVSMYNMLYKAMIDNYDSIDPEKLTKP